MNTTLRPSLRHFARFALALVLIVACGTTPPAGDSLGTVASAMNGPDENWAWFAVANANVPAYTAYALQTASDPNKTYVIAGNAQSGDFVAWDGTTWTSILSALGASVAYDSNRGVTVAVGYILPGDCNSDCAPSTYEQYFWSSDGTTLAAAAQPPARAFPTMTYDSTRRRVVLFGGQKDDSQDLNDTWEWDGTVWANRTPSTSPPAGVYNPITFDSTRGRSVMFTQGATWEWDGTTWTQPSVSGAAPTYVSATTFDANHGVTVLGDNAGVTWTWNGTSFTKVATDPNFFPVAYDGSAHDVFDFRVSASDGSLNGFATWNGSAWSTAATSTGVPQYTTLVYDAARAKLTGIGSYGDWTYDPSSATWTYTYRPSSAPGPVTPDDAIFDAGRNLIVAVVNDYANNTQHPWEFNGTTWTAITPSSGSHPNGGPVKLAYDAALGHVVAVTQGASLMEIWQWDGANWSKVSPATGGPSARGGMALAYDATTGREALVLYGGVTAPNNSYVNDTWLWNGTTWSNPATAVHPPPGPGSYMTYLPDQQRVVLVSQQYQSPTYAWDGTTWTTTTDGTPFYSGENDGNIVYDSARHQVVAAQNSYVGGNVAFLRAHGGACTSGTDSTTGYCVDGVSCDQASCPGTCIACNVAGYAGQCASVTGADDSDTCSAAVNGSSCNAAGACKALPGTAATSIASCLSSGYITDGVCCSVSSCGFCQTCNGANKQVPANDGNCAAEAAGIDTKDECAAQVAATCGQTGACDGAGACQAYPSGTLCGAAVCDGNTAIGPTCASGVCSSASTGTDCAPYACTAVQGCATICAADTDCAQGYYCEGTSCVAKKSAGVAAATGDECTSGYAVDGVCCLASSCGTCLTCNGTDKATPADDGMCAPQKATLDTKNDCAATPTSSCGTSGLCDGHGACAIYASGVACGPSQCVGNLATGSVCSGGGACIASSAKGVDCSPYACTNGLGCATSCSKNTDCAAQFQCAGGKCIAVEAATCSDDHTLVSSSGQMTDCGAYKCAGSACVTMCTSVSDCTSPNICDANQHCVAPSDAAPASSGCSCDVVRTGRSPREVSTALLLGLAIVARRRRRPRVA